MKRLGTPPEDCVAIEDAASRVAAAKAAGTKVVGYAPAYNKQNLSAADLVVTHFKDLDNATVGKFFSSIKNARASSWSEETRGFQMRRIGGLAAQCQV